MSAPAIRVALANARAAEAQIVNYARDSVDLAYLRNIAGKLSAAMDALQRELEAAPPVAGREHLEGMLVLGDIEPSDAAPVISFTQFEERVARERRAA